ncbi:hypothetical protein EJB05_07937, partial [Eragrostis curvula]
MFLAILSPGKGITRNLAIRSSGSFIFSRLHTRPILVETLDACCSLSSSTSNEIYNDDKAEPRFCLCNRDPKPPALRVSAICSMKCLKHVDLSSLRFLCRCRRTT